MLDKATKNKLKDVVFKYLKPSEVDVFVFGSRALGTNRKFSDIDLGLKSKSGKKISSLAISNIEEDFDESDLPLRVDVVDFTLVSDKFKDVALKKIIKLD